MDLSKLTCPEPTCGDMGYWLFDASTLLEREFEDVYFVVTVSPEGIVHVEGRADDARYLDSFNMPKWLKEARHMVEGFLNGIDYGSFIVCPKCKEPLE